MYDVDPDHAPGLAAAIVFAAGLFVVFRLARFLSHRRVTPAMRLIAAYHAASPLARTGALLMLVSGVIHLALVPGHRGLLSWLFAVDGLGFIGLAAAAFVTTWWRRVAIFWLGATILAYLVWVIAGWETPDQVGVACKLIELVALGAVLRHRKPTRFSWPRRLWRAVSYPLVVALTTTGIFVGGLAHPDALHRHAGALLQPVSDTVTAADQRAAAQLLNDTRAGIAKYQDPATAIAAGFRPSAASDAERLEHWVNKANASAVLDPARPQDLVYLRTSRGLKLIGAMFQMPKIGQWGPDPGGPLTAWHQHEGICFSPFGIEFSFATPFWTCPIGSTSITTPPMLHVWLIDNGKNGPFSPDLDPAARARLLEE